LARSRRDTTITRHAVFRTAHIGFAGPTPHPARATAAIKEAIAAGFEHLNLDIIYGTPGESSDEVARTLETVLETEVDHVSAYALTVEPGTALSRKVRRGEIPPVDEDLQAFPVFGDRQDSLQCRLPVVRDFQLGETWGRRHQPGRALPPQYGVLDGRKLVGGLAQVHTDT